MDAVRDIVGLVRGRRHLRSNWSGIPGLVACPSAVAPLRDAAGCRAASRTLMSKKRRSYEQGNSPKFLVVIDDSPECDRAVHFAARRALRIGSTVVMLRVIETHDHGQQWLGV